MPTPKTLNLQKWMDWDYDDFCDCGCRISPFYTFTVERGTRTLMITYNGCWYGLPCPAKYSVCDEDGGECYLYKMINEQMLEMYIVREWSDVIDLVRHYGQS